jgi:hypothetical protein
MRLSVLVSVVVCALAFVGSAGASQLIARNASNISLQVNSKGKALITYRAGGRVTHLIAWGAINARPRPATPSGPRQVKFKLDYSGGWGPWRKLVWKLTTWPAAWTPASVRPANSTTTGVSVIRDSSSCSTP